MKWTPEIIAELREMYPAGDNDELAQRYGVSRDVIVQTAIRFGIRKAGRKKYERRDPNELPLARCRAGVKTSSGWVTHDGCVMKHTMR